MSAGRCKTPAWQRALARLDISNPHVCWLWPGATFSNGYGHIGGGPGEGGDLLVHVVVFEAFRGAVPCGLDLDHTCHTTRCPGGRSCPHRRCANFYHLEPVTRSINLRRGHSGGNRRVPRCNLCHRYYSPEVPHACR